MLYPEMVGQPEILSTDGTAAATTVLLRPVQGDIYLIMDLSMYHDDPAARDMTVSFTDSSNNFDYATFAALAQNTPKFLRADCIKTGAPIVISNSNYIKLTFSAMAAGKKGYIRGYGHIIHGIPADAGV